MEASHKQINDEIRRKSGTLPESEPELESDPLQESLDQLRERVDAFTERADQVATNVTEHLRGREPKDAGKQSQPAGKNQWLRDAALRAYQRGVFVVEPLPETGEAK